MRSKKSFIHGIYTCFPKSQDQKALQYPFQTLSFKTKYLSGFKQLLRHISDLQVLKYTLSLDDSNGVWAHFQGHTDTEFTAKQHMVSFLRANSEQEHPLTMV